MNTGGQHVCILLGPAEIGEEVHWKRFGRVESSLDLAQVASILSRATLYIGNDSGVSHLAGAVGARGGAIFGPTRPDQWRPLGGAITVVRNQTYRKENPNREGISLEEIPVQQVINLLDQWSGSAGGAK
jgi:ADP-heptose:LPS heptosyltransferase